LISISLFLSGKNDTILYLGTNGKINPEGFQQFKKTIQYRSAKKIRVTTYSNTAGNWVKCLTETFQKTDPDTYRVKAKTQHSQSTGTIRFEPAENEIYRVAEKKDNQLIRTGYTKSKIPLILHGIVTVYYPGGNKRSESVYSNNELVSNRNWLENGEEYLDNIFYSVDTPPRFLPGMDSLHRHLLETFEKNKVDYSVLSGEIEVGFVVTEDGEIGGLRLLKGINNKINRLVLSAFQTLEGEWKPARLKGKNVRYLQKFPINFMGNRTKFEFIDFQAGVMHWD